MMSRLHFLAPMALVLASLLGMASTAPAQAASQSAKATQAKAAQAKAAPERQFVDGIAAIVNKHVITLRQLADRSAQIRVQMQQQGVPVPGEDILRRQVLQQMINEELQRQEAERLGLRVSDQQIDQAVQTVAQRNRITVERLRQEIDRSGLGWDAYREELRLQIRDDMLRQHLVADQIYISDSDIDAFLSSDAASNMAAPAFMQPEPEPEPEPQPEPPPVPKGPELIELAQILIEVPERATDSVVAEKRKKAEALRAKLRKGANFAGLAASDSDGPQALDGGNMGIRALKDWPDLFIQAVRTLGPGQISGIVQSGRGFHILKVLRRGYAQPPGARKAPPKPAPKPRPEPPPVLRMPEGPIMITQTHVRHILIKTDKVTTDDKARSLLENLRNRIAHGESFAELARRYSEDASAPQGGDLGWVSPGDTVPAFEQAMDALADGQVSQPIKSPFGWHLIQVEGRRSKDMADEFRRMQARRELMQRRIGPAYEEWLDQLRSQAFIENRLEDQAPGAR